MRHGFEDLDLDRLRRRRSEKWRAFPPDVLPAFVAEMDYDLAEPVKEALRSAIDLDDCGYANPGGVGETFARFAAARHGWTVDPSLVHLVPDVMAGVDLILSLATEPGDGVVINTPVYPPFFDHIRGAGRRIVEVPLVRPDGRWEIDFEALEAAFAAGARGYLLCSPHNPTGRVFSAADLNRIAALAERYGVLVMSDEIHAPLTLPGVRHTPFVSLGGPAAEHGVTLASASKAFNVAGLKAAVAVAGSPAVQRLLDRLPAASQYGAGLFGVLASLAAWDEGGGWLDARAARPGPGRIRRPAGAAAAAGLLRPARGELPGLGRRLQVQPRPGARGGVPEPRPGGPRRRAPLRPAGPGARPGDDRDEQRAAGRHRGPDGRRRRLTQEGAGQGRVLRSSGRAAGNRGRAGSSRGPGRPARPPAAGPGTCAATAGTRPRPA